MSATNNNMTNLNSLPDELILQILAHNVPQTLSTRRDFPAYIRSHSASKRLLRLARDAFFQTYTHKIDLSAMLSNFSRHRVFSHCQTSGILAGRKSFVRQVRKLNLRLHVYYAESVQTAIGEVESVLKGYERVGRVMVAINSTSLAIAEKLERRVRGLLEGLRVRAWDVEVFVAGHKVVKGRGNGGEGVGVE